MSLYSTKNRSTIESCLKPNRFGGSLTFRPDQVVVFQVFSVRRARKYNRGVVEPRRSEEVDDSRIQALGLQLRLTMSRAK